MNFNIKEIQNEKPVGFDLKKPQAKSKSKKKYLYLTMVIVIVIILIIGTAAFIKGWFSFSRDRVELEVIAPMEVSSGENIKFTINCQNNNRVALKNVKLIIDYPKGVYSIEGSELTQEVIDIGNILAKGGETKNFEIRLTGEKGSVKSLSVKLNYQPANISSYFENSTVFKINISSVLIGLYLTVPQKAISGEEVSYILDYINNSNRDFSDLRIELDYPSGFFFKGAEPQPILVQEQNKLLEKNNLWQLKKLEKNERGTIKISGILEGIEGENKILGASVGELKEDKLLKYSQTSSVTQISSSPLSVSLFLNNSEEQTNIRFGEKLNYRIKFENNTDIALSQLILKLYFQGDVFNFKTLNLREKGFFDSLNNVIIWSAAGVPSLALLPPGESGEVAFSLSLEKDFPINNFDDKNFRISVQAELETFNVPPQFNLERLKIEKISSSKVRSMVVLQAKGYYNETTSGIDNFGPIPPKVDETTTYTIHWQIINNSNDLENVQVTATLPQGIEWRDTYTVSNRESRLEYNERTKQIIWAIDKIPAATGFLIPVCELVFQIALRPSITQIRTTPILIDESSLEGRDTFTEEILEAFSPAIAANLPDDLTITINDGRVVE